MAYVYIIYNNVNDYVYIGQTCSSLQSRLIEHIRHSSYHQVRNFFREPLKTGEDKYYIDFLEECSEDQLDNLERLYIEEFDSVKNGYNSTLGGQSRKCYTDEHILMCYKGNVKETALLLNTCEKTISRALKRQGLVNQSYKQVSIPHLNLSFYSISECAKYLIDKGYTKAKESSVQTCISRVLTGNRKSYLNMQFSYIN